MIKPLNNSFLFVFMDDAAQGKFIPKTKSGIILTNQNMDENRNPRWGKVIAIGPEIKDFNVGQFVLIEPLQWTIGFEYDGIKLWKSDDKKVMCVSDDESVTYLY